MGLTRVSPQPSQRPRLLLAASVETGEFRPGAQTRQVINLGRPRRGAAARIPEENMLSQAPAIYQKSWSQRGAVPCRGNEAGEETVWGGQLSAHRRSPCREDTAEPQTHKTESTHDLFSPGRWRRLTAQLRGPGSSTLPPPRAVSREATWAPSGEVRVPAVQGGGTASRCRVRETADRSPPGKSQRSHRPVSDRSTSHARSGPTACWRPGAAQQSQGSQGGRCLSPAPAPEAQRL